MSDDGKWAAPGSDGTGATPAVAPDAGVSGQGAPETGVAGPEYGQYAPPSAPQAAPAVPQYGQYAPPSAPQAAPAVPQYGQYAPPPAPQAPAAPAQPQYGQYAPPPAPQAPAASTQPQYGQYAPPPAPGSAPQYGQYAPPAPQYGAPQYGVPQYGAPQYGQQPSWQYAAGPAAAPGQWAPPPKPGLIPLRPLGFGTLLGASFQVVRRNPKATFGSGLIVQVAITLITVLFVGAATVWAVSRAVSAAGTSDAATIDSGNVLVVLLSLVIPLVLSLFGSALLQGVLVLEVARATLGEKRRLGELWKAAFRRILPLAGWFAIIFAAAVVGIGILVLVIALFAALGTSFLALGLILGFLLGLGMLVLAAWLGTKLSAVPSVIVLERVGVGAAIRRSWQLTRGNFWRTFGVIVLVFGICYLATQIISTPFSFIAPILITLVDPNNTGSGIAILIVFYVLFLAFTIVLSALTAAIQAATVAVIYIDLRMRKEGLDIELARFVEQRQDGSDEWPDPYLPRPAAPVYAEPGFAGPGYPPPPPYGTQG
ncbi:glycerophosphoryl diester phosphodiesterase membrane domain-containing protein [Herbiconiux solani]|uniref:glycerophosphoryl diester phosphodiesterase membrane domain-containing protein n=1 Tax=Herbiconiux solani TaxID=661329 RepID=UPI000AF2C41F|nr:hypothetical protein [Herbiconiux solani]